MIGDDPGNYTLMQTLEEGVQDIDWTVITMCCLSYDYPEPCDPPFAPDHESEIRSTAETPLIDSWNNINPVLFQKTYPNPFTNQINLDFLAKEETQISIRIFMTTGQEVFNQKIELEKGETTVSLNEFKKLNSGVYYLEISDGKINFAIEKLVKIN